MKKWVIIATSVVLVAALGITLWAVLAKEELQPGVLAKVRDVEITEDYVNDVLQFNQIHVETYTTVISQSMNDKNEAQKYIDDIKGRFPTTKEEVLTHLIRGEVVCQQMEKEGTLISKENAEKTFDQEVGKTEESFSKTLQQVLTQKEITMEEYLRLGKMQSYVFYNMQLAKENFENSSAYHKTSPKSLSEQFESYVNRLEKKGKVNRAS